MDIPLTFINQSEAPSSNVVIFQKNLASRSGNIAIAWQVIANSTPGSTYSFVYSDPPQLVATDSEGLATEAADAHQGMLYRISAHTNGNQLQQVSTVVNKESFQLHNNLQLKNVSANVYRAGQLLASKTGIAPQQKAVFQFKPTIWIGAMSQVEQGQIMNAAILNDINTEISLLGITKANIIMTGGGPGKSATPFQFQLHPK